MNFKEIGKRIQNLRISTKTPKKSLSDFLEISQLNLENIESGNIDSLSSDIIEKLSNLYFCPINYILTGENPVKNRVDFNYEGSSAKELENMANIFKITKNNIEMDKMLEDNETRNLEAEEIRKQRCRGLSLGPEKPSIQSYTDTEPVETKEEREQREFEETQWDEYFFNDFNPYGL